MFWVFNFLHQKFNAKSLIQLSVQLFFFLFMLIKLILNLLYIHLV